MRFPYLTLVLGSERGVEELTDPQKTGFEALQRSQRVFLMKILVLLMLDVHMRLSIKHNYCK